MNTAGNEASATAEEDSHQLPIDSRLSNFIDSIINKTRESENATILPSKMTSSINTAQDKLDTSLSKNEHVEEILSAHETAKKLSITPPKFDDDSSGDEGIVEHYSP